MDYILFISLFGLVMSVTYMAAKRDHKRLQSRNDSTAFTQTTLHR